MLPATPYNDPNTQTYWAAVAAALKAHFYTVVLDSIRVDGIKLEVPQVTPLPLLTTVVL